MLLEDPKDREVEEKRYTLIKMETVPGDDYQKFVSVRFESDSPTEFEKVVFDQATLVRWIEFL